MGKKISIIIPCYNAQKYIIDSLDSIIMQNYKNYEIIVVDGASNDGTLDLLDMYKEHINILISEADNGPQEALNKGFGVASGDVLCWLNSDDVYLSESVLSYVNDAFDIDEIDFLYGHHMVLNQDGIIKKTSYTWMPRNIKKIPPGNVFTGCLFFSSQCWKDFVGFDQNMTVAFEYQLWDYLVKNYRAAMINCFMAGFRIYPGTISSAMSDEMITQIIKMRGGRYYNNNGDLIRLFDRIKSLFRNKMLLAVIRNSLKDKYRGIYWRDLERMLNCLGYIGEKRNRVRIFRGIM